MGGEGRSKGISSALGIWALSGLAEKKGEETVGRGEEAEVAGPEPREAASLPIPSS